MNEIQRLIHEMCPDGVPMVALGEIGSLIRGNGLQKKDFVDQGVGCIHYGQIYTRFGLFTNKTLAYVSESLANKLTPVESGNLVIACTSENVEDVCKCVAWLGDQTIVTGGHAVVFKHSQNPKYIAYCFTSEDFQIQKRKYAFGAKVIDIKIDKLASIQIPLPPLPIQQRIVEILDKFTSLVSSLDSEIALRQKQYEYYRDKLLSFEEGEFENKRLGDIASFKYGYTGAAKDEGEARYVRITDITPDGNLLSSDAKYIESINEDNKMYLLKKGDLLVARIGATYGKTLYFNEDYPSLYASFLIKINFKNDCIDSRYYWQFSKSHYYWSQANKLVGGGAQPQFNANALCDVIVPIPPKSVQQRIVRTLDTFESLLTNLKKERELRQKQYEYYREKLLTFA